MMQYGRAFMIAVWLSASSCSLAQANEEVEAVQKRLESLSKKLSGLQGKVGDSKTDAAAISKQLNEISEEAGAISAEVVVLKSGDTFLAKGKTSADSIKQKLDALNVSSAKSDQAREELLGQTNNNLNGLIELRFSKMDNRYPNKPHAFLKLLLKNAGDGLKKGDFLAIDRAIPEEGNRLKPTIIGLIEAAQPYLIDAANATPATTVTQIEALTAVLGKIKPEDLKKQSGSQTAVKNLGDALKTHLPPEPVLITEAAEGLANQLVQILPGKTPGEKKDAERALLQQTPNSITALTEAREAISQSIADAGDLVVKIVEAKYGDYPVHDFIEKRWCDATAAMRNACNGKPSCEVPENHSVKLCGYNPAPAALPSMRGLFVKYECVYKLQSNFNTASLTAGGTVTPMPIITDSPDSYVVLREKGALVCSLPKD